MKRFFKPKLVLSRAASLVIAVAIAATLFGVVVSSQAHACSTQACRNGGKVVGASLNGFQEVPPVMTPGTGTFTATINSNTNTILYNLTYSGLTSPVTFAAIHLGQPRVNGGVIAFLCGGGNTPACPNAGTVTGIITAADILPIPGQGLAAGGFAGAVSAIQNGVTSVNVHTILFPGGEIRGQITVLC